MFNRLEILYCEHCNQVLNCNIYAYLSNNLCALNMQIYLTSSKLLQEMNWSNTLEYNNKIKMN